ncbi:MAG: prolyl oligopeptidase family serine peptidase [Planctomycetota bacterium]|nr:prolyl oligopeptidase family serine peptidase [Planctomycetota bacterium]
MRRPPLLVLALLLALPVGGAPVLAEGTPPGPPPPPKVWNGRDKAREVKGWIKEYATATAARQAEIRAALDALGSLKLSAVKTKARIILKAVRKARPKLEKKASQTFTHDGLSGTVHLLGAKKKKPLFLALHGGGQGVGDGKNAMQKWGMAGGKCIVIAPTTPKKVGSAWNQPDVERWVLALLAAAKRTWDVDTNRIYVAGHSMGGYGTWSIGARHADQFAALCACAGGLFGSGRGIVGGHVPNLLNTPIWFYNSTDDKQVSYKSSALADEMLQALKQKGYPYVWTYDQYDDIGHGVPKKGLKPMVDWLLKQEREPHPRWVVWEPSRDHKRRFAWIGRPSGGGRVEGKIDGNRITLSGAPGTTVIYLNPQLVDLTKPVTIVRGEETLFAGFVYARLSVLLDTIAADEDPKRWYCASVTVR